MTEFRVHQDYQNLKEVTLTQDIDVSSSDDNVSEVRRLQPLLKGKRPIKIDGKGLNAIRLSKDSFKELLASS